MPQHDDGRLSPRRRRVAEHLKRAVRKMTHAQLEAECAEQGLDDLLLNRAIAQDRSKLCSALLERLLAPWEVNDDTPETVDAWLACTADAWPESETRQRPNLSNPQELAAVLDPDGPWGARACGVEIRVCTDDPRKGRGAYTTRIIDAGRVVGVYAGELLDQRTHSLRHASRGPLFLPPDDDETTELDARRTRLQALSEADGAPMGGADNHGGYAFALLPDVHSQQFPGRPAYVDAEDPMRSSWPRFVNHASDRTPLCNVEPKVAALQCLVWLQARRRIEANEELCFDYGPLFDGAEEGVSNLIIKRAIKVLGNIKNYLQMVHSMISKRTITS